MSAPPSQHRFSACSLQFVAQPKVSSRTYFGATFPTATKHWRTKYSLRRYVYSPPTSRVPPPHSPATIADTKLPTTGALRTTCAIFTSPTYGALLLLLRLALRTPAPYSYKPLLRQLQPRLAACSLGALRSFMSYDLRVSNRPSGLVCGSMVFRATTCSQAATIDLMSARPGPFTGYGP